MKKTLLFSILFALLLYNETFAEEIQLNARVKKATIYWQSASIEATASKYLNKGEHLLIIEKMPNNIDLNSIQVLSDSKFNIVSVESRIGNPDNFKKSKQYQDLKDSLESYEDSYELIKIKKFAVDEEISLWISNKNIGAKAGNVVELEDLAEVYKTRIPQLKRESYVYEKNMLKLKEKLTYFQELIKEKGSQNNVDVLVRIMNPESQNVDLTLKYLCYDAGWTAFYDIRSEDKSDEISFILKANVWQNSGIDFNDIELTLSTGRPNNSSVKPELYDWRLSLSQNEPRVITYSKPLINAEVAGDQAMVMKSQAQGLSSFVETSESMNKIEYHITKSYDIVSGTGVKIVEIQTKSAKANYRYVTIPKLDNKAYLIASINDWDKLMLTNAEANVFINGAFISKTVINPAIIEDSLEFSLGDDESIKVERKLVNDQNSSKTIGSTKKINQKYEISVRNTKSKAIKIDVLDQIPLSGDKSIEITYTAQDGSIEPGTGKLTWSYTINSEETKKMSYQFEIKYPKKMILVGW
ncbi:MAG: DUF4139 domain-containing protein [bacterium]|jgi:uncharacterized protein (TIGR02231 family)